MRVSLDFVKLSFLMRANGPSQTEWTCSRKYNIDTKLHKLSALLNISLFPSVYFVRTAIEPPTQLSTRPAVEDVLRSLVCVFLSPLPI